MMEVVCFFPHYTGSYILEFSLTQNIEILFLKGLILHRIAHSFLELVEMLLKRLLKTAEQGM